MLICMIVQEVAGICVCGGAQKLISQYGVFQLRSAVYMSGREKPASTSVIPHYAVKSAFLDYELRTSLAKEVKGQMSIVTQLPDVAAQSRAFSSCRSKVHGMVTYIHK